ncbi:MAG: glycosyltransferase [Cyclobacteriaceae bacterium]|nr:glycosyltransferase [Cyclobacteriaceae bacterium]
MSKTLVVLTIDYPDPLLDKELPYLAAAFDKVYVLYAIETSNRELAFKNIKPVKLFQNPDFPKTFRLVLKHFRFVVSVYLYTIIRKGNLSFYLKHYKSFIGYLLIEAERIQPLLRYISENKLNDAIFYDYWLVDSTLALIALKKRGVIKKAISRTHGFDLYDDRQFESRVPFLEYRVAHLDKIFTISRHGYDYLKNRVSPSLSGNIELSYLGVTTNFAKDPDKRVLGEYLVVSCSSMIPVKRIDKIIDSLRETTLNIRWVHFGDGPLRKSLEQAALTLPPNIQTSFYGHITNSQVLEFYGSNYVDLFISLSESEGLPVSMMEAISFGIPILATAVNGIPEIVTEKTGVLVNISVDEIEVCQALHHILSNGNLDRNEIRNFFRSNFDAKKNYESFAEKLNQLQLGSGA